MSNLDSRRPGDPKLSGHLPALDGLRGLAVLVVIIHHYSLNPEALLHLHGHLHISRLTHAWSAAADVGWIGVDLFFVLSGFLITGILLDSRELPHFFRNFYARRTLRIFPLYYGLLILLFIVLPVALHVPSVYHALKNSLGPYFNQLKELRHAQAWFWFYLLNVQIALQGTRWPFIDHFWSLAVEEHFYLVWPLVVWFCNPRTTLRICIGCVVAAILLRVICIVTGFGDLAAYVLTPCRIDGLAVGALAALLARQAGGVDAAWRVARWLGLIGFAGLAAIAIAHHGLRRNDPLFAVIGYTLLAMAFVALLLWLVAAPRSPVAGLFSTPFLRSFGKYSYCLYVIHPFFVRTCVSLLPMVTVARATHSDFVGLVAPVILGIEICYVISFASWHLYEKHFLKLKRYFPQRHRAVQVTESFQSPLNTSVAGPVM